jgi:hypothetical protein
VPVTPLCRAWTLEALGLVPTCAHPPVKVDPVCGSGEEGQGEEEEEQEEEQVMVVRGGQEEDGEEEEEEAEEVELVVVKEVRVGRPWGPRRGRGVG